MIRSFEGGRGAAAMAVALFHLSLGEPRMLLRLPGAYIFVDLFFVLSGYLICAAYAPRLGAPGALPAFLLRRFGRLFPLLVVASVAFVLMLNVGVLAHRVLDGPVAPLRPFILPSGKEVLATLTMTHALGLFKQVTGNYASWSISTEFYAYIAFAMLCLLFRGRALLVAFAATAGLGYLVTMWATIRVHQCLKWGGCLDLTFDYGYVRCLAGFLIGALLSQLRIPRRATLGPAQLASVAALLLMLVLMPRRPAGALAAPFLFGIFLVTISRDAGPVAAVLKARPLQFLGQQSYSIYLMHPVILLAFNAARPHLASLPGQVLAVIGYVIMVLTVSRYTYRYVEDPMRQRFNRLAATRFPARPPVPVKQVSESGP